MLKNAKNITVIDESIDDTLSTFLVREKLYFAIHGDFDSTSDTSIAKLCLWAKMTPYCILCGHKHYPAMEDVSGIKIIQSGCLCGSGDEYTRQKRLTGKPSQTVLVVNDKGIKCCYPIELD
jgi:predicted phosphodiesterase